MAIRLENVKSVYITEDCRYHSTVKSRQMVVANYVRFPFLISRNFDRSTASYTSSVDVVTSSVSTRDKNAHKSRNILTFQNRIGRENICSKSKRNKVISSQSSRGGNIISNRCYSTGRRKPDIKCRNKSGVVDAAPSSSTFELEEDKSVTDYFNNFDEHTEFALSNEIYDGVSIIGSLLATDMGEEDFDNCRHNEKVLMTMGGKSSKNVLPDDDKSNNTNRNSCEEVYDSDFELDLNDSAVGCDDALLGKRENPSQKKQSAIGNEADTMRSEIALIKRTWRRQLVVDTGCDSPIPTASQKQKVRYD